jgi:hypothetical protein
MPATLRDVYRQFRTLAPLGANDPRYVDCIEERGIPAVYGELMLPLTDQEPVSLLFSGHMGDGKTTILRQFQGLLEEQGCFVAFGEADARLDLSDVEYDDVLLAILAVVDQSLRDRYQQDAQTGPFQQLWQELYRIANLPVELTSEWKVPLGPFGKISATVKDAPDVRLQVRQNLRQARGPTFLDVVNEYLSRAEAVVKRNGHQRLIVLVDNLDRLHETQSPGGMYPDERLFLGQASQLLAVHARVIYTVRRALAHARGPELQERYGHAPIIVPMVPVRRADNAEHTVGMAKLREVINKRLAAAETDASEVFSDQASVDNLCRSSSGHMRDLMTFVQRACAAAFSVGLPLTPAHISAAVSSERALRRGAVTGRWDALGRVAESHRLDSVPSDVAQSLLRDRLVYEYFFGEEYWYDVCALCREEGSDGTNTG